MPADPASKHHEAHAVKVYLAFFCHVMVSHLLLRLNQLQVYPTNLSSRHRKNQRADESPSQTTDALHCPSHSLSPLQRSPTERSWLTITTLYFISQKKLQGHIGPSTQPGHGIVTDHTVLAMIQVRMVTYLTINQAPDCLTSVINYDLLAPSY